MKRLETTLSDTDFFAWQIFCQKTHKSSTCLLREFIMQSIHSPKMELDPEATTKIAPAKILKGNKITVNFTQHEAELIKQKVTAEGYQTPTNWLRCLVMNVLHQEAVLTDAEISTIEKLSYQLWAIGHNLNQVTRAINSNLEDSKSVKLTMIQELKDLTLESRKVFSGLVARNKSRWYRRNKTP